MVRIERSGRVRRVVFAALVLGVGFVTAACQLSTGIPRTAEQFTPPAAFRRWWAMTEACAGKTGNFAAVRFYRMPGSKFTIGGRDVAGFYDQDENRIVLSDSLAAFGAGVRHEMLHAVLGVLGHPRDAYQERCAGIVLCSMACANDGGDWQAPQAWVPMKAESLVVKATAELIPSDLDGERWLSIRTRVTNPWPQAIVARMPPTQSFEFALVHDGQSAGSVEDAMYSPDSATYYFKANETKEFEFELVVSSDFTRYSVPPGDYRFFGGFGSVWTKPGQISVTGSENTVASRAQTP